MTKISGITSKLNEEAKNEFTKQKSINKYNFEKMKYTIPEIAINESKHKVYNSIYEYEQVVSTFISSELDVIISPIKQTPFIYDDTSDLFNKYIKSDISLKTLENSMLCSLNNYNKVLDVYSDDHRETYNKFTKNVNAIIKNVTVIFKDIRNYFEIKPDLDVLLQTKYPSKKIYNNIHDKIPAAIDAVLSPHMRLCDNIINNRKAEHNYASLCYSVEHNNIITNDTSSKTYDDKSKNIVCDDVIVPVNTFDEKINNISCDDDNASNNEDISKITQSHDTNIYSVLRCDFSSIVVNVNDNVSIGQTIGSINNVNVYSNISGKIINIENDKIYVLNDNKNTELNDVNDLKELYLKKNENLDLFMYDITYMSILESYNTKKLNKNNKYKSIINTLKKESKKEYDKLNNVVKKLTSKENIELSDNDTIKNDYDIIINKYKEVIINLLRIYDTDIINSKNISKKVLIDILNEYKNAIKDKNDEYHKSIIAYLDKILSSLSDIKLKLHKILSPLSKEIKTNAVKIYNDTLDIHEVELYLKSNNITDKTLLNKINELNNVKIDYSFKSKIDDILSYKDIDTKIESCETKTQSTNKWHDKGYINENDTKYKYYEYCVDEITQTDNDISNIKYWKKYLRVATLNGLNPMYYSTGMVLSVPIPMPVIYVPISVINTPFGCIVIGVSICGICVNPLILYVNLSNVPVPIIKIPGLDIINTLIRDIKNNIIELKTTDKNKLTEDINISTASLNALNDNMLKLNDKLKYENTKLSEQTIYLNEINQQFNVLMNSKTLDEVEINKLKTIHKKITDEITETQKLVKHTEKDINKLTIDKTKNKKSIYKKQYKLLKYDNEHSDKVSSQFDAITKQLDVMNTSLFNIPIGVLMPNSMNFGISMKKPIITNQISGDIDKTINLNLLEIILDKIKIPHANYTNGPISFEKSIINPAVISNVIKESMNMLKLIDIIPTYDELSIKNLKFLIYLQFFNLEGAFVYGMPGYPPIL